MAEPTSATRSELLKVKAQKKLAIKGHSLLKRKRDALIRVFFEKIQEYKVLKKRTLNQLQEGYDSVRIAQGVSGVNRVKGLAYSMTPSFNIVASKQNLMGVKVPKFELKDLGVQLNSSLIGTSYYVEEARLTFVKTVPDLVRLAEVEQVIFTLAEEIKKTKRRVNALEYIKIPEIEGIEKHIKDRLAEVEREAFFRLKNVKKKLEAAHKLEQQQRKASA